VDAGPAALAAKLAAMGAHESQIGPEFLAPEPFASGYGTEWFVRRGPVGLLEQALSASSTCSSVALVPA
jgi:hypothetical protein